MNGKGSRARPLSVDAQTFAENWDRTFSRKLTNHPVFAAPAVQEAIDRAYRSAKDHLEHAIYPIAERMTRSG